MYQRINTAVYVKVLSEHMNFPLSVRPSKEMGDRTRQRGREQLVGDYRGNCGNVNVKGTNVRMLCC